MLYNTSAESYRTAGPAACLKIQYYGTAISFRELTM